MEHHRVHPVGTLPYGCRNKTGGFAPDADRWVPCKPGFFLSVRVLSRLFWRRFLEELQNLHYLAEELELVDCFSPITSSDRALPCQKAGSREAGGGTKQSYNDAIQ